MSEFGDHIAGLKNIGEDADDLLLVGNILHPLGSADNKNRNQ